MVVSTQVTGLKAVATKLTRSSVTALPASRQIVDTMSKRVAHRWAARVPVRSGTLKTSIDQYTRMENNAPTGTAYSDWFVSRFREYGTSREAPKREAGQSLDETVPEFVAAMRAMVVRPG